MYLDGDFSYRVILRMAVPNYLVDRFAVYLSARAT